MQISELNNLTNEKKKNVLDRELRENELITIKEMFSNNHYYRIPDYQRGYSWSYDKEFNDLWKDIIRIYHSTNINRKHYTGMITLDDINNLNDVENENLYGTSSFYVVDGQQRITSIVIMLKTILDYAKDNEITSILENNEYKMLLKGDSGIRRFGYSSKRQDGADDYFQKRIYESNKDLTMNNQYFVNINDSQISLEKELNKYDDSNIEKIIDIILNRLVFNLYFVTEDFDVRVTFETMNNRGKALTSLELLKNRLMYLSTFFNKDEKNFGGRLQKQINITWKNIYDNLSFKDSRLSDDEYLKAHWIVYQRLNKKKGDAFIEDILNNEFSIDKGSFYNYCQEKEYNKAFDLLNKYIISLDSFSLYWSAINMPDNISFDIDNDELIHIKRLSRLQNNLYTKSAVMVVLANGKIEKTDKIVFYSKLEKFVFINKLLAQDKNDLSFLATYARDLLNEQINYKEKIDLLNSSFDEHILALNEERVIRALQNFKAYIDGKTNFYYEWNGLKYFLYEYNDSLSVHNAAKIEWYKINSASIEHVLPQTPEREYWKIAFADYLGTSEEKRLINSLGNLLLLSSGAENSSLKNYSFPVKKEMDVDSKKFAYCDGSRSARKIAENDHWTAKEIYERSKELIDFLYNNWLIDYIDLDKWNNIKKQLNLINFKYSDFNPDSYTYLINQLNNLDVSEERERANASTIKERNEDYLNKQLLDYFDKEVFYLVSNSKNISYKEWKYSFVITKDKEKKPILLKIATRINGVAYRIGYKYKENTLSINYWINENSIYLNSIEEAPEEIRMFVRSLFRYIRKARLRSIPHIVSE